ncbi:MAG TPA: AraC family transcriptional regulator [Acidimicrobiales bacterium]|nr:AraC family transcriptional regulator [Acidimicrobiales bacterium]
MQAAFEHIDASPRSAWKYQQRIEPTYPFEWHFHEECELTFIVSGRGSRFVGDSIEPYEQGDLVLLGAALPHTYAAGTQPSGRPNAAVSAQFRPHFLGADTFAGPDFEAVGRLLERSRRGLAFAPATAEPVGAELQAMAGLDGARRTVALLGILVQLAAAGARTLASEQFSSSVDARSRATIEVVCAFLARAYDRPVTAAEVSSVAHVAPTTLGRVFRRAMGRSVTTYLIELRVAAACRLLTDSDEPVAAIAARCGYRNLSNFNRQFARLKGTTPVAYRKAFRGK